MKALLLLLMPIAMLASCKTPDLREPEYRDIKNARIIKAGLLQSIAGADLLYYNPNNYSVNVNEAKAAVFIDNKFIGQLVLMEKVTVKKNAAFILPAQITLDNVSIIKNQNDIYNRKEIIIRIEGTAVLSRTGISKELPFKYELTERMEDLKKLIAL